MRAVSVPCVELQVEREERETEALVLRDVAPLVTPQRVARLARGDDDVAERDRGVATLREHAPRERAVGDVEEAAVAKARPGAREKAERVADRIRVVPDQPRDEVIRRRDR
jgi:hypothetical protein